MLDERVDRRMIEDDRGGQLRAKLSFETGPKLHGHERVHALLFEATLRIERGVEETSEKRRDPLAEVRAGFGGGTGMPRTFCAWWPELIEEVPVCTRLVERHEEIPIHFCDDPLRRPRTQQRREHGKRLPSGHGGNAGRRETRAHSVIAEPIFPESPFDAERRRSPAAAVRRKAIEKGVRRRVRALIVPAPHGGDRREEEEEVEVAV
jgi:hypothetical protein